MKKIFLTGITGLLGTNLANTLLDANYQVIAIAREPNKYFGKRTENLQLVQKELSENYDTYLEGVDVVVHIAAVTATNLIEYSDYEKINHLASLQLMQKAQKYKVSRFIFISTANTIGYGNFENPGTESNKIKQPFTKHFYAQTKLKAEQDLIAAAKQIECIILNPTFMIGSEDSKPSSGKLLLMGLDKKVVFYPPGGKNFVPVTDVVQAIIHSFDKGKSGEKYLIAGDNLSYKEFFKKLQILTDNTSQLLIPVSKLVMLFLGVIGDLLRFCKIRTSWSTANMKALCIDSYYDNQKSKRELKIPYSSLEVAMKESVVYFKSDDS